MGVFHHEEKSNPSSNRCKFLTAILKEAFSNCHTFNQRLSNSSAEDEHPASDFDDEQEVVVSAIRSGAMEKLKNKPSFTTDSFTWVFSPSTGELYMTPKAVQQKEDDDAQQKGDDNDEDYEIGEFFSVKSCFSCRSSAVNMEEYFSVKTNFSRCSSLYGLDVQDFLRLDFEDLRRRSIIQEFCHCKGWPFGLCRKALLLPPLPKSPSESWSWHKGTRVVKLPYI